MQVAADVPTLDEIVADLRTLRERGLVRIRHTDLDDLMRAASRTGLAEAAGGGPGAEEQVTATPAGPMEDRDLGCHLCQARGS